MKAEESFNQWIKFLSQYFINKPPLFDKNQMIAFAEHFAKQSQSEEVEDYDRCRQLIIDGGKSDAYKEVVKGLPLSSWVRVQLDLSKNDREEVERLREVIDSIELFADSNSETTEGLRILHYIQEKQETIF